MDFADIIKILVGLGSIAVIITGGNVYFTRRSNDKVEQTTKEMFDEIKHTVLTNSQNTREDYKNLVTHIDDRIERIYTRLETNSSELKEYVAREVSALKAKDYDQDIKLEHTKDKVHGLSEELLKFKLEASEKYQQKNSNKE